MNWNYKREETPRAQAGDHRFEIVAAEEKNIPVRQRNDRNYPQTKRLRC